MNENKRFLSSVLLFGALWGLAEATLGYLLHFLPCGFAGLVMFPIGFYMMYNAYRLSGRHSAMLAVALIAALIKTIDLALPLTNIMSVLNPASSILIEGLVVFGAARFFEGRRALPAVLLVSAGWILLFVLTQSLLLRPASGLYLYPLKTMLFYILLNVIVNSAAILLYLKNKTRLSLRLQQEATALVAPLMLLFAIAMEIGNNLLS
ncbi:MAG: hypothetical protein WC372_06420 [Candidatus Neomarinimicrobiota bacterium]|jgi:hypothetical protein|nr:hypothetical protein [Candidatus Neomarinimicrobiota bacterium]MDD3965743.1 hypothetical protein [Candidatus Neomarinimicrobiota bacterium]MDX9780183.1 hypothetical protein [bacterium]